MKIHPAIAFGLATPIFLSVWRFMPNLELALAWYAWSFVAIAMLLQVFRREIPDGAVSLMVLLALASSAAAAAGDANLSRLIFGLNILILLLLVVFIADDWLWGAYAVAGGTELLSWLLGNAARGTFGPDVAQSAIGQAFGPWAWSVQLLIIAVAYIAAARHVTTAR